ncbi:MAG: metallophosphoesterase [Deltaproteobacteria bacterium]|jgi:3',5'-cyclic AMP phosphodiesterase CpdA|nr:metallophosphoesterase [Deltaproteobacteria bacterium]
MLIGQISDLHILANRGIAHGVGDTSVYLEALEEHLAALTPALDGLVITGDLADKGEREAYVFIKNVFSSWKIPIWIVPGNHDLRVNLVQELGAYCPAIKALLPFLCYSVDMGPIQLIMLDSVVEGEHHGGIDQQVADWLEARLEGTKDKLVMVFAHHPPFLSFMGDMDLPFENADRLIKILSRNPQVLFACGHLHCGLTTFFQGVRAVVAPPVSLHMDLELTATGGNQFNLGAPAFVLHHFEKGLLNSHFGLLSGNWPFSGPHKFLEMDMIR